MSTATELAELEASIAEAELTDEEAAVVKGGVEQGVPVAEAIALVKEARAEENAASNGNAAAAGDLTAAELEELDKALKSHTRKVRAILGERAAELVTCEHCDGMGLTPPGEPAPEPKAHEYFQACETCNALGQVLTGSRVAGNVFRPCPDCGGRGYLEALDPAGTPLAGGGQPGAPALTVVTPIGQEAHGGAEAPSAAGVTFGRPSWLGDPSIGGQ